MFNLFKGKKKIKELEARIAVLEGKVTLLNEGKVPISFKELEVASGKVYELNCYKTNIDEINAKKDRSRSSMFCDNCTCKDNGSLVLQIDGVTVGKVALNKIRKIQR